MTETYFDFIPTCEYAQNRAGLEGCAAEHLAGGKRLLDIFPEGIRALCVYNPFYGAVVVEMKAERVWCGDKNCQFHGWRTEV